MIGERFRKLQLDQDDIDSLKQGVACAIQRLMLDHASQDHDPSGTLIVYFDPPKFYVTLEIDGTTYEESHLVRGMSMYAQIHFDNVNIAWQAFLQGFEQELKPILEERLKVTAIRNTTSNPKMTATATPPLVVRQYLIHFKPPQP